MPPHPAYSHVYPFVHTFSSKYAQRMRRLSCKIFNEFYIPELSKKEVAMGPYHKPVLDWTLKWHTELRVFQRHQELPLDLNNLKNANYYPAHPQIRALTNALREYGLYRDEHRDFNEAMKAVAIGRGKVFRERRGPLSRKGKK